MFSVIRHGFLSISEVVLSAVTDLKANGFVEIFNNSADVSDTNKKIEIVLESPSTFSLPLQKWRIKFAAYSPKVEESPRLLCVMLGTEFQIKNDGKHNFIAVDNAETFSKDDAGANLAYAKWGPVVDVKDDTAPLYGQYPKTGNETKPEYFFYSRNQYGTNELHWSSAPMSYFISITNRGVFFGLWDINSLTSGKKFSWLVVQRSVDKTTGYVRGTTPSTSTSVCPLFCFFSSPQSTNEECYGKIIVRQRDIYGPSPKIAYVKTNPGTTMFPKLNHVNLTTANPFIYVGDVIDNPAFLNPFSQVSFNENGDYIVTFISDLTTPDYAYPDEIDMVATISSEVIGTGQEIQFTVYGESAPRTYIALPANAPNNTGMRLLVLKDNPNE